jgi:hypothetical protein
MRSYRTKRCSEAELRKAGFEIESRKEDIDENPAMDHARWAILARRGVDTALGNR